MIDKGTAHQVLNWPLSNVQQAMSSNNRRQPQYQEVLFTQDNLDTNSYEQFSNERVNDARKATSVCISQSRRSVYHLTPSVVELLKTLEQRLNEEEVAKSW